jgi:hypothetical protein
VINGDLARVREALGNGQLLHPASGDGNLVDLAQAMAWLAGATIEPSATAQQLARTIGDHQHYVFVLADGLGMNLIDQLPPSSFLRTSLAMELRSVFPSSTAPALTSLATARWPAEHAVVGWWTYLPDAGLTATILPYIERFSERPLDHTTVAPSYAFPVPARTATFRHAFQSFAPRKIAGSTYSRYSSGNMTYAGYTTLAEAVDTIVERVQGASGPTYSYLYAPHVDTEEHLHGLRATEVELAVAIVQQQMQRLVEGLAGRGRLVLTADHGQFTIGRKWLTDRSDPLMQMLLIPPTGDGRTPFFHVKSVEKEGFAEAFRKAHGKRFALLTIDEIEELQLLGPAPLSTEMRRRAGDFGAIAFGEDVILYEPTDREPLRGYHGGLTPDEMRIPLVLA